MLLGDLNVEIPQAAALKLTYTQTMLCCISLVMVIIIIIMFRFQAFPKDYAVPSIGAAFLSSSIRRFEDTEFPE